MKKDKIDWLTGLKGFGCVTVVFLHLLACLFPNAQNGGYKYIAAWDGMYNFIQLTPLNIFFNGSFFVYVFWTISAYLMALSYKENSQLFEKLFRKFFRLFFTASLISIIAFVLLKNGFYYYAQAGEIIEGSFWITERDYSVIGIWQLVRELLWDDWFATGYMIPPLWTMKTELVGCLTTGFILSTGQKDNKLLLGLLAFALFGTTLSVYSCFLVGILLSNYSERKPYVGEISFVIGCFLGAYPPTGVPVHGVYNWMYETIVSKLNRTFFDGHGVWHIYIIASGLMMFGIIKSDLLKRVFSNKVFVFLGELSMIIYLCHIPVIWSLGAFTFYSL